MAQRLAERRRGGIVLMSSLVGFQDVPFAANNVATKVYVQSLAAALRVELAPFGLDVIAPGVRPDGGWFAARADMRMGATVSPGTVARGDAAQARPPLHRPN